jgi:molecular chaperone IbpA
VGFDRVFACWTAPFTAAQTGDATFRIELAVAGFSHDELSIVAQENVLTISGSKSSVPQQMYLHHGIASRAFDRRFNLAEYVKVEDANLSNGLLTVDLVREVPEAMRARQIAIGGSRQAQQLEQKAA